MSRIWCRMGGREKGEGDWVWTFTKVLGISGSRRRMTKGQIISAGPQCKSIFCIGNNTLLTPCDLVRQSKSVLTSIRPDPILFKLQIAEL